MPQAASNRDEVTVESGLADALAAAERQCSFVAWDVSQDEDHVVLHVTADPARPDDVAPIAALFGAD